jgi:hypothetical protein
VSELSELAAPPSAPGKLYGREHLTSNVSLGVAFPLLLLAVSATASGWATGWVIGTWVAFGVVPVADVAVWLDRRRRSHDWEHKWTLVMMGSLIERDETLRAEIDQLRADHEALKADAKTISGEKAATRLAEMIRPHNDATAVSYRQQMIDRIGHDADAA